MTGQVEFVGFTDPLEMLEIVHAAAARLRELAGPALIVTIAPAAEGAVADGESAEISSPARNGGDAPASAQECESPVAPSSSTPSAAPQPRRRPAKTNRESAKHAEALVADYLRQHGGRARQAGIASDLGLEAGRVRDALSRLSVRGEARRTGAAARAPGVTVGRASPVWELVEDHGAAGSGERAAPRAQGEAEAADRPAPDACPTGPASAGSERVTPAEDVLTGSGADHQNAGAELTSSLPGPSSTTGGERSAPGPGTSLSPRTRKSIERAQAEEAKLVALGEPPESTVLDQLRERAMSISELAAVEATSRVFVAEELHALKPWLVRLPDGKYRAIERLRPAA